MRGGIARRLETLEGVLGPVKPFKVHLLGEHDHLPDDYAPPPDGEVNVVRLVGVEPGPDHPASQGRAV